MNERTALSCCPDSAWRTAWCVRSYIPERDAGLNWEDKPDRRAVPPILEALLDAELAWPRRLPNGCYRCGVAVAKRPGIQ